LGTGDALPITERQRLGAPATPHIVLDCVGGPPPAIFQDGAWNRTAPDLVIFDDTFVDQNICSGLIIESEHRQNLHELILGSQGVALNRSLQDTIAEIEEHNRSLRSYADVIPAEVRYGLSVDDFCALPANPDIDNAIRDVERSLAASSEGDAIRTEGGFEPIALPEIDLGALERLLARGLADLDRSAAERVHEHIAALGRGGEAWVGDGMLRIPRPNEDGLTPCPFCAQDLAGSVLIGHYRSYFGAAYADLKREIAEARQDIIDAHGGDALAVFERAVRVLSERRQFWARFYEMPELGIDTTAIAGVWAIARNAVLAAVDAKSGAPLDLIVLDADAREAITNYNEIVESVFRQEYTASAGQLRNCSCQRACRRL
jgi:hypothetical protein